jgi:hypothetical protein
MEELGRLREELIYLAVIIIIMVRELWFSVKKGVENCSFKGNTS